MPKSHIKKKQKSQARPVASKVSNDQATASDQEVVSKKSAKISKPKDNPKLSAKAEHDKVYIDQRLHYVNREIKRSLTMVAIVGVFYLVTYLVLEKTSLGSQMVEFFTL
ncbi:hypothetical protein H6792_00230 [Candidatus Nomurabacteria bacterium]|nr:hypothetical protein [Candidatus Nomurabacteria bacterium]